MANRVFTAGPDNHGIKGSVTIPGLEVGFIYPELYTALTPAEQADLNAAYEAYGEAAAKSDYLYKKVWDRENTVDWTGEWQRGLDREMQAKQRLENLVQQYAQKYGMGVMAQEPEVASRGSR